MRPSIPRSRLVVAFALAIAAACSVELFDPTGRACDEAHRCGKGRFCVAGLCVGGTPEPDAGPCVDGAACAVGVGACRREGTRSCGADGAVCSATPGPPGFEHCDGIDNDCDGRVDVGGEVDLVPPSPTAPWLAWTAIGDGYDAVYGADRGGGSRLYLQRLDLALGKVGPEIELPARDGANLKSPTVVARDDDLFVAWLEDGPNASARIVLGRFDHSGAVRPRAGLDGSAEPAIFVMEQRPATSLRLARANDRQFLLLSWIDAQDRLVLSVFRADGTMYRPPNIADYTQYSDGGVDFALEAVAAPIGNNDFQVGAVIREQLEAAVKFGGVSETLGQRSRAARYPAAGGATNLRIVNLQPADGGRAEESVAAWINTSGTGVVTVLAVPEVGMAPLTLAGPSTAAADWSLDALSLPGERVVIGWVEGEARRVQARTIQGTPVDLTPANGAGRIYPADVPVALAGGDGGTLWLAYPTAGGDLGAGIGYRARPFCVP